MRIFNYFLLASLTLLFSTFTFADELPHIPKGIIKKGDNQYCAKNGEKFGHTVVLIDMTTPLTTGQIDEIKGRVFNENFFKQYKPLTKFSYLVMEKGKKPQSLEYAFSKCRPKSGKKTKFGDLELNTFRESEKFIKKYWKRFIKKTEKAEIQILNKEYKESNYSYIYEAIANVFRLPKFDFSSDYKTRNLIIVSDMMQHTQRISFYDACKVNSITTNQKCPSYSQFLSKDIDTKDYINSTSPNAKGVNVQLVYMNFRWETNPSIDTTLITLWRDYFKSVGFSSVKIDRMTDVTTAN